MYTIDTITGKLIWKLDTGSSVANVNFFGKYIVLLNNSGYLFVINENGSIEIKENVNISSGPQDLAAIAKNIIIDGKSNRVVSCPFSYVLSNKTADC